MGDFYKFGQNVVNREDKGAFNSSCAAGEIGEFEARSGETAPELHKPNGYLRKRAPCQLSAESTEWIRRVEFLNMADFDRRSSKEFQKGKMIVIDKEGSLRAADGYGRISRDAGAYHLGKLPYFLKISKIREVVYCIGNICNRRTCRIWHNMLYRS